MSDAIDHTILVGDEPDFVHVVIRVDESSQEMAEGLPFDGPTLQRGADDESGDGPLRLTPWQGREASVAIPLFDDERHQPLGLEGVLDEVSDEDRAAVEGLVGTIFTVLATTRHERALLRERVVAAVLDHQPFSTPGSDEMPATSRAAVVTVPLDRPIYRPSPYDGSSVRIVTQHVDLLPGRLGFVADTPRLGMARLLGSIPLGPSFDFETPAPAGIELERGVDESARGIIAAAHDNWARAQRAASQAEAAAIAHWAGLAAPGPVADPLRRS